MIMSSAGHDHDIGARYAIENFFPSLGEVSRGAGRNIGARNVIEKFSTILWEMLQVPLVMILA